LQEGQRAVLGLHPASKLSLILSFSQSQPNSNDLSTSTAMTILDVIGQVYSEAVKRELSDLAFENKEFAFSCKGFVSGANYSAKRGTFIFFINRALQFFRVIVAIELMTRENRPLGRLFCSQAEP
jgi:hypothetical protein